VIEPEDEMDAFRLAFFLLGGLLVTVAVVNLATTVRLTQRERRRDGAVRRAVGFTPGQELAVAGLAGGLLAVVAGAVGLGAGWGVHRVLVGGVSEGIGVGPGFGLDPSAPALAAVVPVAVLVGTALGVVTALGGARRPVVMALHDE
jgi:putative ABC transport system permease protein